VTAWVALLAALSAGVASLAGASLGGLRAIGAARRRRWMARHPAPTFVFADLVGYTSLAEICGDHEAARVAREFRHAMSRLSRQHRAWHVKTMGDGAMIWSPDATQAVALAMRVVDEVGSRPDLLPIRVGAHTGPAVMQHGDWYGSAVNVAARLSREAEPNEVLISGVTQAATDGDIGGLLEAGGERGLRGLTRPVRIWRLAPRLPVPEGARPGRC
jgi:adenylate cyclase